MKARSRSGAAALRPATALVLLAAACVRQVELPLPVGSDGAGLLLVRSEGMDDALEIFALERARDLPPFAARDGDELVLAVLGRDLPTYGLTPGPQRSSVGRSGRPLPIPEAIYAFTPPAEAWNLLDELPEWVADVRLAALETCPEGDGCRVLEGLRPVCVQPCPVVSPVVPPSAPEPPMAWSASCPSGWPTTDEAGPGCAPPSRKACSPGTRQPLLDRGCRPIVPCPQGEFRRPQAGAAYVSASAAVGGTGEIEAPFASIGEALAARAPPLTLSLGAGVYAAPAELPDGLTIVGACPDRTSLRNVQVARGAVTLDGVRLDDGFEVRGGQLIVINASLLGGLLAGGEVTVREARWVDGPSVRVGGAARLTIEDADLEVRFEVGEEAALTVRRSAFARPAGPLLALRGASVAVLDGSWGQVPASPSSPAALVLEDSARLEVTDAYFSTPSLAMVSDRAALTLRSGGLAQARRFASAHGEARLSVERFVVRAGDGPSLFEIDGRAVVELERMAITGTSTAVVMLEAQSQLTMRDLRVDGPVFLARAVGETQLRVERIHSTGGLEAGANNDPDRSGSYVGGASPCKAADLGSASSTVHLTVSDLWVEGRSDQAGLAACAGTQATLRNVALTGLLTGLYADCDPPCDTEAELTDLDVEDLLVDAREVGDLGIMSRGGRLRLERAAIRNVELFGLYNWGSEIQATDLVIERIGARARRAGVDLLRYCTRNQGSTLRAPGSGIFSEVWARNLIIIVEPNVSVSRFRLSTSICGGLTMGVSKSVRLQDGEFSGNHHGLSILRFTEPTLADPLVFRDNVFHVFDLRP